MNVRKLTIFVNGLFNPKDEDIWSTYQKSFEDLLQCEAVHIHNPTLAIDIEETGAQALQQLGPFDSYSKWLYGASILGIGAIMVDSYMEWGIASKATAAAWDGVRDHLGEKARLVAEKLRKEIIELCTDRPQVETIHLFAHSHGGWCTKEFLQLGYAKQISEVFKVRFEIIVAGCPVHVPSPTDDSPVKLVQIHNALDVLSLRYADKGSESNDNVIALRSQEPYHAFAKYLEWISENYERVSNKISS